MFKERAILSNSDRFYKMGRQIIKADDLSFGAFPPRYRADQFRFELGALEFSVATQTCNAVDRFAVT